MELAAELAALATELPFSGHSAGEPWLDLAAAAAYCACAPETLREMIARGDLPFGRVGERGMRVRRSDLDRALLRHAERAAADTGRGTDNDPAARILRSLAPR
jgi:excisionase family DNA binding protein